jgi:biopolymer transport protein ExbB
MLRAAVFALSLVPAAIALVGVGAGIGAIVRREQKLAWVTIAAALLCTPAGLLATAAGLVLAFAAVADAEPSAKATLLAEGIDVAMRGTLAGLVGTLVVALLVPPAVLRSRPKSD